MWKIRVCEIKIYKIKDRVWQRQILIKTNFIKAEFIKSKVEFVKTRVYKEPSM
jgi:hypothetical protein